MPTFSYGNTAAQNGLISRARYQADRLTASGEDTISTKQDAYEALAVGSFITEDNP